MGWDPRGWLKRQVDRAQADYDELPSWLKSAVRERQTCQFVWGHGFKCELTAGHKEDHRSRYNDGVCGPDYVYHTNKAST